MTANLRTFLDLNTDHLPPRFYDSTTTSLTGGYHLEHGMLLWVPPPGGCIGDGGTDDDNAPEVIRLREYAREVGAEYVLLDRDAPHDETLPIFDDDGEVERVETCGRCGAEFPAGGECSGAGYHP